MVAEPALDLLDVATLCEQTRRDRVTESVEARPSRARLPSSRSQHATAQVLHELSGPLARGEHEPLVARPVALFARVAQLSDERGAKGDVSPPVLRLRR